MEYHGQLFTREQLPYPYNAEEDHYIQIGPNVYMGPSGKADDFVNHSCDPNSGLIFENNRIQLKAIRTLQAGEEINYDYSTTMDEAGIQDFGDWEMDCNCGGATCRGAITDFSFLPDSVKEKYIELAIMPEYIVNQLSITPATID